MMCHSALLQVQSGAPCSYSMMSRIHALDATALHIAARQGNGTVVQWLLDHGAHMSLTIVNRMHCTPLDVARIFGPFYHVEGQLGAVMLIRRNSLNGADHLTSPKPKQRRLPMLSNPQPTPPRRHSTAVKIQYPMWVISVSNFIQLSELRPHQELRTSGQLEEYSPGMSSVFFLSHQWTSFTNPDHSTLQLRTIQQLLLRMSVGGLSDTVYDDVRRPLTSKYTKSCVLTDYLVCCVRLITASVFV